MTQGLDVFSYQEAITAQVRSLYPHHDILEDTIPDDKQFSRDLFGKAIPFIVLRYGPLLPKFNGKAMAGVRHDEYFTTLDVMAVAPEGAMARKLCWAVTNDLLGWSPDGVAKIGLRDDGGSAAAFAVASNEARPSRIVAAQRLQYSVNTNNIGWNPRP